MAAVIDITQLDMFSKVLLAHLHISQGISQAVVHFRMQGIKVMPNYFRYPHNMQKSQMLKPYERIGHSTSPNRVFFSTTTPFNHLLSAKLFAKFIYNVVNYWLQSSFPIYKLRFTYFRNTFTRLNFVVIIQSKQC